MVTNSSQNLEMMMNILSFIDELNTPQKLSQKVISHISSPASTMVSKGCWLWAANSRRFGSAPALERHLALGRAIFVRRINGIESFWRDTKDDKSWQQKWNTHWCIGWINVISDTLGYTWMNNKTWRWVKTSQTSRSSTYRCWIFMLYHEALSILCRSELESHTQMVSIDLFP